ncbi:unnamed protein product, partial [marine sediment metagenome]
IMRKRWTGQELYNYSGTFVWIVESLKEDGIMEIAYWGNGETEVIEYQELKSATPNELAGIA